MPYRATTASGNTFDFDFELHPETAEPVHVSNLLSAVLETLDREIALQGRVGNGDVLQALAMALAVRGRIIGADPQQIDPLVKSLVEAALTSTHAPADGNVAPDAPRDLH